MRVAAVAASGQVALDGDDAGVGTAADDVADEGLALEQLVVAGLGELLDDLDRAGGVEVEALREVVEERGQHGTVRAQQRRLAALEQPGQVPWAFEGSASNPSSDRPAWVRSRSPADTAYGSTVRAHRTDGELTTR